MTQTHEYSNIALDQCLAEIGQGEYLNIYESPKYSEEILTWHLSYSSMSQTPKASNLQYVRKLKQGGLIGLHNSLEN